MQLNFLGWLALPNAEDMAMGHWLIKQEPTDYSWANLVKDKRTTWTGVRNFQARNNLRAMKKGDLALFYHSGDEKAVVGIAKVVKESFPDPTAEDEAWIAVDVAPLKALPHPVTLAAMKGDSVLKEMALVRQSRLSVSPVSEPQLKKLLQLAGTEL